MESVDMPVEAAIFLTSPEYRAVLRCRAKTPAAMPAIGPVTSYDSVFPVLFSPLPQSSRVRSDFLRPLSISDGSAATFTKSVAMLAMPLPSSLYPHQSLPDSSHGSGRPTGAGSCLLPIH